MGTIARRLMTALLLTFAVGRGTLAYAVPFEELSGGRRARYTAEAAAVNALPVASAVMEPKCLQGYILCKLTFAAFSVIAAGESLVLSGGGDLAQPKAVLYRGFSGDWVVTPRDIAGETKPDLLPEPPPPAEGEKKDGGFVPPPL
jgi:hypothetical protein